MLTQRPDQSAEFTRRDLARLLVAAILLILALTTMLAVDVAPGGLGFQVGTIAQESIRAPRALTYSSEILTQQARADAADAVAPQYDYSPERAADIATQQGTAFGQEVTGVDAAFASNLSVLNRQTLLETAVPGLTEPSASVLSTLDPQRWLVVRNEAARVLDEIERTELRDTDLATQRQFLSGRIQAGLTADERTLAIELISPLIVANSLVQRGDHPGRARERLGRRDPGHPDDPAGPGRRGRGTSDHRARPRDDRRVRAQPVERGLRQAGRLVPPGGAARRSAARVGVAIPARPVAPQQRAAARRPDAGVHDLCREGHRRPLDPAVLPADRGGRDPACDPARRRRRRRPDGGHRGHRRSRQQQLARDRDLRLPRRVRRHRRRAARRQAARVRPGRARGIGGQHRRRVDLRAARRTRPRRDGRAPALGSVAGVGGRLRRGRRRHVCRARQPLRDPDRVPDAGACESRRSRSSNGCSSRHPGPTTTR